MAYKEVLGANLWQYEKEGDSIEGEFVKKTPGQFGDDFVIKTKSGEEFKIFGSIVLRTKFEDVKPGQKVRITYMGEVKAGSGKTYKDFKVEVEE